MRNRVVFLSVVCGVTCHAMLTLQMGQDFLGAFFRLLVPAGLAGVAAGWLTLVTRQRAGRERCLDVSLTCVFGAVAYILIGFPFSFFAGYEGGRHMGWLLGTGAAAFTFGHVEAILTAATYLVFCAVSRHLVWRVHGRVAAQLHNAADDASHRS